MTNQVGHCSECKADIPANARFCSACGASFTGGPSAQDLLPAPWEYDVIKALTHEDAARAINLAAHEGWEPVFGYAWGSVYNAQHAVVVRRARA
jgi:hypothetical protein